MKVTAITTILFATLALAAPKPDAAPAAAPAPASEDHIPAALQARFAGIMLESRDPKKSKTGSKNNGNNTNSTGAAAGVITPSRALQLGALGLGAIEVVRLWG